MELYTKKDEELLEQKIEPILDKLNELKKSTKREMDDKDIENAINVILKFIKDNKRKIYGGYAMNFLIKQKNPEDAFYKKSTDVCPYDPLPDIDFYSDDPIKDIVALCNLLQDNGFENIKGSEALHRETYNIFIDKKIFSQISYVPKNIYHKLQFINIDGIYFIHPIMFKIDFLRMMSDPLLSYWRIAKQFKRFILVDKYYPFTHINKSLKTNQPDESIKLALDVVLKFVENRSTIIVLGYYAFNHYLYKVTNKTINVPNYDIISTEFKSDSEELIKKLKDAYPNDITFEEYYPFFQLYGYSVRIYYKKNLIATIYHYNKICVPFLQLHSNYIDSIQKVNVATFSLLLGFTLQRSVYARVNDDTDLKDVCLTMASNLIDLRHDYFNRTNTTIYDDTLFKDFVINCIGEPADLEKERQLLIEERKKLKKKYTFSYIPAQDRDKPMESYVFLNTSGNKVNNEKNLKLTL